MNIKIIILIFDTLFSLIFFIDQINHKLIAQLKEETELYVSLCKLTVI